MSDKKTMTSREYDIAAKMRGVCAKIVEPHREMVEAQDQVTALSSGLQATRLSIAQEMAALSASEAWLPGEIEKASKHAAKTGNDPDSDRTAKTLATLISEMRLFAHPKVRAQVDNIVAACTDAWESEEQALAMVDKEDRKSVPTPVHKYSHRKYHLIVAITRAVRNGEVSVVNADDVVTYASANDPDHDAERVAKRLESVVAQLEGIFADFGNDDINTAMEFLKTINAKELLESRKAKLAAEGVTPVVNTPVATPAPIVPTVDTTVDTHDGLVGGAIEIDELMNDLSGTPANSTTVGELLAAD